MSQNNIIIDRTFLNPDANRHNNYLRSSASPQTANTIITLKNSRENYTSIDDYRGVYGRHAPHHQRHYNSSNLRSFLNGPRESCEDSVCNSCDTKSGADIYKACKMNCINNNADAIKNCCMNSCPTISSLNTQCAQACNTPLVYGGGNPSIPGPLNPPQPTPTTQTSPSAPAPTPASSSPSCSIL
jgi:hypothetical protein